jgi:TolB-like protein/AraC-like DNA-binding protein
MDEGVSMDQLFLDKVQEAIENNLSNENFGVDELAFEIGISRTHLHRKLNSLAGQSASQMIKEFRLKRAMEMLQDNVASASEISYKVGFSSPSYFNTCFHEYYGYPPGKVKRGASIKKNDKPIISNRWKIASYISIIVIVTSIVLIFIYRTNRSILENSIAVLPFEIMSIDEEYSYFGDAITDDIIIELKMIKAFDRVVTRNSTAQYDENKSTIPAIAKELKVEYIMDGSIQQEADTCRISVWVIRVKDESFVWGRKYDMEWKDILFIQDMISQSIAKELQLEMILWSD